MNVTKVLGLAAVGALLMLAVPTERAQALSLSNPGAAAAVQDGSKQMTTEVRWGRWHQPPFIIGIIIATGAAGDPGLCAVTIKTGPQSGPVLRFFVAIAAGSKHLGRKIPGSPFMTKWIGAVQLALTLMFGRLARSGSAAAAPLRRPRCKSRKRRRQPTSARGVHRHHTHYAYRRYYRPYYPTYYDRPYYYAPAPFFPFFGLGYGPWWYDFAVWAVSGWCRSAKVDPGEIASSTMACAPALRSFFSVSFSAQAWNAASSGNDISTSLSRSHALRSGFHPPTAAAR